MPSRPERVDADADLLPIARRHYTGRGELADQLWWSEHPGTTAPSGAADPRPALEEARAALYRPGPRPDRSAEDAQDELALLAADRAAAHEAMDRARAERPPPDREDRPRRAGSLRLAVGIGVVALLVGAAAGFATGRFTRTPAPAALAIFDATQRPADRPPVVAELPPLAPRSAYRLIGSSSSTGAFAYGVRTRSDEVCLVVVVLAQHAYSTCTPESAFAIGGLTLSFSAQVDPQDDSGIAEPVGLRPSWAPDGEFTF